MAWPRHEHKDSPRDIVTAYMLLILAALLVIGAAYGLWLLVMRFT